MKKTALTFLLLILFISGHSAGIIYIDPRNPQPGDGTRENPFRRILTVQPETFYYFRAGTVNECNFSIGQTTGNTFATYGEGPRAIIRGSAGAEVFRFNSTASNININSLEITATNNAGGPLVHFRGAGINNTIENCLIHGGSYGIRARSQMAAPYDFIQTLTIKGNTIFDILDDGIYLYKHHNPVTEFNIIFRVNMNWKPPTTSQKIASGDGGQWILTDQVVIRFNHVDRSTTGNKFCFIFSGTNPVQDNYFLISGNTFILPIKTQEGGAGLYFGDLPATLTTDLTFNSFFGDMPGVKYCTNGTLNSNGNLFQGFPGSKMPIAIELQLNTAKGFSTSDDTIFCKRKTTPNIKTI